MMMWYIYIYIYTCHILRTLQQRGYENENERVKFLFWDPQLGGGEGVYFPLMWCSHIGHHPQEDLYLVIGHVKHYFFL
jgi:hypothetical protein